MMNRNLQMMLVLVLSLMGARLAVAAPETSAVSSPKCDEEKVRKLCGDALVKIEKAEWAGDMKGFNITLDTSKMTFGDLTKKMLDAGCF